MLFLATDKEVEFSIFIEQGRSGNIVWIHVITWAVWLQKDQLIFCCHRKSMDSFWTATTGMLYFWTRALKRFDNFLFRCLSVVFVLMKMH